MCEASLGALGQNGHKLPEEGPEGALISWRLEEAVVTETGEDRGKRRDCELELELLLVED